MSDDPVGTQHKLELEFTELRSTVSSLARTSETLILSVTDLKTAVASLMGSAGKTDARSVMLMVAAVVPVMLGLWAFGVQPLERDVQYLNESKTILRANIVANAAYVEASLDDLNDRIDHRTLEQNEQDREFYEWKGWVDSRLSSLDKRFDVQWNQATIPGAVNE